MRPKGVAIQLISTGGFYGAERALLELALYLCEQGWESHILALEGKGAPELVRRSSEVGLNAVAFTDGARLGVGTLLSRLGSSLGRHSKAIVHSHGYKPDILLAALRTPHRLGCLATCHSWYSDSLKMKLFERLDKRLLRGFDHVIAVSDEIGGELLASGIAPDKISKIDNGISVPHRDPEAPTSVRNEFALAAQEKLIVQIGRLAKSKRNDLLLQAVTRLPRTMQVKVLLVGDGSERPALMEKTRALGIADRVVFCGYRGDVHRIIAAADVMALTSDQEGLPIVILEAMALGCPIVSTAVGAIPTVLQGAENGWVVPVNDLDALTAALAEALGNQALARTKANEATKAFFRRFAKDVMGERYLALYERTWSMRGWT